MARRIAEFVAQSSRVDHDDLDWEKARRHGLTEQEVEVLKYFADVEGQTVYYFIEVAKLKASHQPELLTYLTIWNYEEYFHSHAITRLLEECGVVVENATQRLMEVRAGARLKARLEDGFQTMLATLAPRSFLALWMTWGATQELLTAQAYDQIAHATTNPVCQELCRRIGKQERRHFALYYREARERLEGQPTSQWLVRTLVERMWSPVGNGVKTPVDAARIAEGLFPGPRLAEVLAVIDRRIGELPGMCGIDACSAWAQRMGLTTPPARAGAIDAADERARQWAILA